ncbi:kelch-like protein 2 isoform 1-T4 [Glossina fuscipes fuscipes]
MIAGSTEEAEQLFAERRKKPGYGNAFLDSLNKMRINRENCDFALEVEGETIYAHRLALAIASPYFAAMFQNDTKEKATGLVKFEDNDVTAVKTIVEYIYSGELLLTEENVQSICTTSDYLQIEWVKSECVEFLKRNLNATNCLQLRTIADKPPFKELYECSHNYILENFVALIHKKEWLEQPFEVIQDLIKDDKLSVNWEDNAYKGLLNWIKYDLTKRQSYLAKLMRHVRLTNVRTEFLRDHILNEILLTSDPQCNQFFIEALRYQLTPRTQRTSFWSQTKHVPTNRNGKFHVVFAGGKHIKTAAVHRMCKVYYPTNNKTSPISDMLDCRLANSVISLNDTVYSVGGYCGNSLKNAECYDPVNKKWSRIEPMNSGRFYFGICAHANLIYAIGGYNLSSVENYNPATDKWYTCPDTPVALNWRCRATVIKNSIYSLSRGINGITSCIRFDSREGRWYNLNEMPGGLRRATFEFMSYDSSLFSIAEECSRLDIRTHRWEAMPSMLFKRLDYSAAIIADDIYVFGGASKADTDGEFINSVERYNIHNNEWTAVDSVEVEVCGGAAAVISGDFNLN